MREVIIAIVAATAGAIMRGVIEHRIAPWLKGKRLRCVVGMHVWQLPTFATAEDLLDDDGKRSYVCRWCGKGTRRARPSKSASRTEDVDCW